MSSEPSPAIPLSASRAQVQARPAWARWVYRYRLVVLMGVLGAVVGADQSSKAWASSRLARPMAADGEGVVHHRAMRQIQVIRGIWHFRYVENPAAAFSLTRSIPAHIRLPLLKAVSYLAMGLLLVWLLRLRQSDALLVLGFSLVLGGAVGNAVDRHLHGYVIDFIDWRLTRFFPGLPPWPTFNIADMAIVGGALAIVYRSFVPLERPEETAAKLASAVAGDVPVQPVAEQETPGEAGPLNEEAV